MVYISNQMICVVLLVVVITREIGFTVGDVLFVTNIIPAGIYSSNINLDDDEPLDFTVALPTALTRPVALDYNPHTSTIYWSDVSKSTIERYSFVTEEHEVFVSSEAGIVDGLVVDATGQKLYWTSTTEDRIEVINLDGTERTILFDVELDEPRAIELDSTNGYLYWTDWGQDKMIERVKLDDLSTRTALVTTGLVFPNGLVLSVPDGKMYWCDAGIDAIEEANLDGSSRRKIIGVSGMHPFDIDIYGHYLYVSDWESGIYRVNKWTGAMSIESSDSRLSKPAGLYIVKGTMCDPECLHGTCEVNNACTCDVGYYGSTCENTCGLTDTIDNCETVDCTSSSNSVCVKCLYHVSADVMAYELVDGRCNQLCSWRSDSKSCYPGTCSSSPESCDCDPDFMGSDCMTISVPPTVSQCSMSLQLDDGVHTISTADIQCQLSAATPIYTSLQGNSVSVNWQTQFSGPSTTDYPFPYYVNDFKVGVTSARISWTLSRGTSLVDDGDIDCNLNHDRTDPNEGTHSCARNGQLSGNLQNGDSLMITVSSTNGGFLRLNNYDDSSSPTVGQPIYYAGQTVSMYLNIVADLEAPTHCSVTTPRASTCIGNSLEVGDPYIKSRELEIKWSTWMDAISGLSTDPYDIKVCKMIPDDNLLIAHDECLILDYSQSGVDYEAIFQPTSLGVYCAVLSVSDIAGNTRYARRCFIVDDESEITITDGSSLNIAVDGETYSNNSEVQITGNEQAIFSWKGHFVNQLQVDESVLFAIGHDGDDVDEAYDSNAPPEGRPLTAIANIHGITKFEYAVAKDKLGGTTFNSLKPNWKRLPSDLDEMVAIELENLEDKETFGFWVRATDVIGNTRSDFVSIHIASTESIPIYKIMYISGGIIVFILLFVIVYMIYRRVRNHTQPVQSNPAHAPDTQPAGKGGGYWTHVYDHRIDINDERLYARIDENHYDDRITPQSNHYSDYNINRGNSDKGIYMAANTGAAKDLRTKDSPDNNQDIQNNIELIPIPK